jgi:hypothetical protein
MKGEPMKTMLITLIVSLGLAGCSKDTPESSKSTTTTAEKTEPKKDVKPGSHEDWCEEHQVPESQCTLCDPKLAAAFKATGDWCEEHGLPESQCRKCNADLKIVRPPKESN